MLEHTVAVAALQGLQGWYLRPLDIKQLWPNDFAQIVVAFDNTPHWVKEGSSILAKDNKIRIEKRHIKIKVIPTLDFFEIMPSVTPDLVNRCC